MITRCDLCNVDVQRRHDDSRTSHRADRSGNCMMSDREVLIDSMCSCLRSPSSPIRWNLVMGRRALGSQLFDPNLRCVGLHEVRVQWRRVVFPSGPLINARGERRLLPPHRIIVRCALKRTYADRWDATSPEGRKKFSSIGWLTPWSGEFHGVVSEVGQGGCACPASGTRSQSRKRGWECNVFD